MKKITVSLFIVFLSFAAISQDNFCESIVVEGKASVKTIPEIITFNINFSVLDTNYTKCAELAFQKFDRVKSEFIENKIDEELIQTLNYSIREEREHNRNLGKSVFKGYRATIPILIKSKTNEAKNNLIFEIIKNNFQSDFTIHFSLSPEQKERVKSELLKLAVLDATNKAKILAESAGVKPGKISKIQAGEPQAVRNFTRSNFDLMHSMQLESVAKTVYGDVNSLTPTEVEMQTSILIAWKIDD